MPADKSGAKIATSATKRTKKQTETVRAAGDADHNGDTGHSLDEQHGHTPPDAKFDDNDDTATRIARAFMEDFVVTTLLRQGRVLRSGELAAAVEGFSLSRAALREGLTHSQHVTAHDRSWDLALRTAWQSRSRDERTRRPLEGTLEELLQAIGKPLPLPVVVRELSIMRGVFPDAVREAAAHVLRTARLVIEVAPGAWLHESFTLDAGAPSEELIIRENKLAGDRDFRELQENSFAAPSTPGADLSQRAAAILQEVARPLSQKTLGFFLWRQNPRAFNARALAVTLGNRSVFYPMIGGFITTQAQLPQWRAAVQTWIQSLDSAAAGHIDVIALLRQRVAPTSLVLPRPEELEEVKKAARAGKGQPLSVANALIDVLEVEPDDPQFVPALQGLNDSLRRSPEFLPSGIGRFLLRESVPAYVGEVPQELRPVHLSLRDMETDELLDVEMSDDGLEGDAVEFVHAPEREDVNEEVEVKLPRHMVTEIPTSTRYVILSHHHRAGTMKLRRMDEDFFAIEGPLSRLSIIAEDEGETEELGAWASREGGLIYGLGEWFGPRTPPSGGVLEFSRDAGGLLRLRLGTPDKLTRIEGNRVAELETLRERSAYLSLFDLLQSIMAEHPQGVELPTLWAEVNAVRRTTKRLVCSVLAAYHCFYFKQRGPRQILWRFDAGKLDQGFKRNKRKYVRR